MGAVELQPLDGQPGVRGMALMAKLFEAGLMARVTGDIIAFSPPLIVEDTHLEQMVDTFKSEIRTL